MMKAKKRFLPFDKVLDVQLLKQVEQNKILYDTSHPKHMDLDHREVVWQQIGQALNRPGHMCKTRWVNIRDMMRRKMRERVRNPQQRTFFYRYEPDLAFVIPFIKDALATEYNTEGFNESSQLEVPAEVFLEEAEYMNDSEAEMKPNLKQLINMTQDNDKDTTSEPYRFQELNSNDPIDVFLLTIGVTLRKFHPYYLNQAKSKIFQVVQDYELQQICDNEKDGNNSAREISSMVNVASSSENNVNR